MPGCDHFAQPLRGHSVVVIIVDSPVRRVAGLAVQSYGCLIIGAHLQVQGDAALCGGGLFGGFEQGAGDATALAGWIDYQRVNARAGGAPPVKNNDVANNPLPPITHPKRSMAAREKVPETFPADAVAWEYCLQPRQRIKVFRHGWAYYFTHYHKIRKGNHRPPQGGVA